MTLQLNKQALPLHEDATAKIRPRIFLEGNFFVDLRPGSPDAPELDDGGVIKVTHTASPVQLDEVLTSLQSDTRQDLKDVLDGLATALNKKPTAADDKDAAPSARGETGAQSFNDAYVDIPVAERSTAQVFEAFLGQEPGTDLSRLIDGTARTAGALIRHEEQLKDLITNFNMHDGGVRLRVGQPARLDPRAGADARERQRRARVAQRGVPAHARVRARDPARRPRDAGHDRRLVPVDRADAQARLPAGARRAGRGALAGHARPRAPDRRAIELLPQTDARLALRAPRSCCPTGDVVIKDEFATGAENYKEFFYALVGLAGEGQNFDGNGMYVRFQTGGGTSRSRWAREGVGTGELFGNNVAVPLGNRPFYPGKRPPYRPDVACYKQKLPNLNGPAAAKTCARPAAHQAAAAEPRARPRARSSPRSARGGGAMIAIRKHLEDFAGDHRADADRRRRRVGDPVQPAADAAGLGAA